MPDLQLIWQTGAAVCLHCNCPVGDWCSLHSKGLYKLVRICLLSKPLPKPTTVTKESIGIGSVQELLTTHKSTKANIWETISEENKW